MEENETFDGRPSYREPSLRERINWWLGFRVRPDMPGIPDGVPYSSLCATAFLDWGDRLRLLVSGWLIFQCRLLTVPELERLHAECATCVAPPGYK